MAVINELLTKRLALWVTKAKDAKPGTPDDDGSGLTLWVLSSYLSGPIHRLLRFPNLWCTFPFTERNPLTCIYLYILTYRRHSCSVWSQLFPNTTKIWFNFGPRGSIDSPGKLQALIRLLRWKGPPGKRAEFLLWPSLDTILPQLRETCHVILIRSYTLCFRFSALLEEKSKASLDGFKPKFFSCVQQGQPKRSKNFPERW